MRDYQGAPAIVGRIVTQGAPIFDGTPAKGRGFRAYVELRGPGRSPHMCAPYIRGRYACSPLFETMAEAEAWSPPADPVPTSRKEVA